jgi:DNA primase
MRGEVASRATARIGVPRTEFERLLGKPTRERFSIDDAESRPRVMPPPDRQGFPVHDANTLSLLALRSDEAFSFLREQNWKEVLNQLPNTDLLARILENEKRPDDPASLHAFMEGLSADEKVLVSSWMSAKTPPDDVLTSWSLLRKAALRRQISIVEARMKLPQTTSGEMTTLQKQILDLTEQLRDVSAFSSARVLDN